ncbi:MAG: hypothetical protein ACI4WS_14965 [Oscillospiraceae bacterium]
MADNHSIENDELQIYRGKDYVVNDFISIRHPTLDEIAEYGEREYLSLVSSLTATPSDLMYQLHLEGIDFTKETDFGVFCRMYKMFDVDSTRILFGALDIASMELCINNENEEIVLSSPDRRIIIDKNIHRIITDYLRKIHGFVKNERVPGNESTKRIMLEDAEEEFKRQKNKAFSSVLQPLMSSLVGSDLTSETYDSLWKMKINVFMDTISRTQKVMSHHYLMQGIYSGNVDFKKINKKELVWNGKLE